MYASSPVPYPGFYGNMMQYVAGQLSDGEVERREFVPSSSAGGWPVVFDESARKRVEGFVLKNTPSAHQFIGKDGQQRVVYMDERGRAVDSRLSDVPDADLVRIARRYGMSLGAPNDDEPKTSKTDHGYSKPRTEERLREGEGDEGSNAKGALGWINRAVSLAETAKKDLTSQGKTKGLEALVAHVGRMRDQDWYGFYFR